MCITSFGTKCNVFLKTPQIYCSTWSALSYSRTDAACFEYIREPNNRRASYVALALHPAILQTCWSRWNQWWFFRFLLCEYHHLQALKSTRIFSHLGGWRSEGPSWYIHWLPFCGWLDQREGTSFLQTAAIQSHHHRGFPEGGQKSVKYWLS